jgi:hypothetical protein
MEFEEFERRLVEARALVARHRQEAVEILAKNVDLGRDNADVFERRRAGETGETRHNTGNSNPT